ncbi:MAG: NTP transferase domain-containing protein [Chloroflexi bacterium]|nr:sugar phosphate nucleotidyltransferase [Anaerolineaceae bacterium]NMB90627.1 NTP transferase domain-containing protein [Chloroflexota bacterium]
MRVRAIILAGGEGTRLGVLTAKRTKPAVPFGGKYRIIDFALSNCVNSNIFDVMIIAQYRPHSLIEHIGAGGPWDLNRDFTGGVRIYTPYKATVSGWFAGTADAVQQNFSFIKRNDPDLILILSGDHVYSMDYSQLIRYHLEKKAEVTVATIQVPLGEASRFGIVDFDPDYRITSFVEKPSNPPSNLANMGIYVFNLDILSKMLWEDHLCQDSSHDFGKDILPNMVKDGQYNVYAYPYSNYWVDVGTVNSYWSAHMDLLANPPMLDLNNRGWIIHTRTEERPPIKIESGATVEDCLICDGSVIENGATVVRSVLSPGVHVSSGAHISESILLTDVYVDRNVRIERSILDKRARICSGAVIGGTDPEDLQISMIGKNSVIPEHLTIEPGALIGTDVVPIDFLSDRVKSGDRIQTRRLPNEL